MTKTLHSLNAITYFKALFLIKNNIVHKSLYNTRKLKYFITLY